MCLPGGGSSGPPPPDPGEEARKRLALQKRTSRSITS